MLHLIIDELTKKNYMINNYSKKQGQSRRNHELNEPQVRVLAQAHAESNPDAEIWGERWATIGFISLLVLEAVMIRGWLANLA